MTPDKKSLRTDLLAILLLAALIAAGAGAYIFIVI